MTSSKLGIVAYDEERKSSDIYLKVFNSQFANADLEFVQNWDNVDSLSDYTKKDGISILNEMYKIIVLDQGFNTQIDSKKMVDDFISLQEVFANRGVNRPFLVYATSNQEVYDLFKNDEAPNGHPLFPYQKTRVFRLKKDSNGKVLNSDIEKIITGEADETALSIRKDYQSRGDVLNKNLGRVKEETRSKTTSNVNMIRDKIIENSKASGINSDNLSSKEAEQKRNNEAIDDVLNAHEAYSKDDKYKFDFEGIDNENNKDNKHQSSRKTVQQQLDVTKTTINDFVEKKKGSSYIPVNLTEKLTIDKNTILFTGRSGSGVTSIIYNIAKVYESYNRKVLIINLDSYDDILKYFSQFKKLYDEKQIRNVFKTNFISLDDVLVNVDHNISILSDYGKTQREQNSDMRISNLSRILTIAQKTFDIILIDGGTLINSILVKSGALIDNLAIVTEAENISNLDDYSNNQARLNDLIISFIDKQKIVPGIIVNKLDFKLENDEIEEKILNLKTSLNRCRLISTVLYDKNWNLQSASQVPYAFQNDVNYNIMRDMTERVVV